MRPPLVFEILFGRTMFTVVLIAHDIVTYHLLAGVITSRLHRRSKANNSHSCAKMRRKPCWYDGIRQQHMRRVR